MLIFLIAPSALIASPQAKAKPKPAPAKPKWDGDWTLSVADSDVIKDRIASFTQGMNLFQKTVWKKKLTNACFSYQTLSVLSGMGFSFSFGKEVPINVDSNGTAGSWTRQEDEEKFQTSLKTLAPNSVSLVLTGEDYTLTDGIEIDGDTLTVHVTYSSPKIPQPFDYSQVYKRNE